MHGFIQEKEKEINDEKNKLKEGIYKILSQKNFAQHGSFMRVEGDDAIMLVEVRDLESNDLSIIGLCLNRLN